MSVVIFTVSLCSTTAAEHALSAVLIQMFGYCIQALGCKVKSAIPHEECMFLSPLSRP